MKILRRLVPDTLGGRVVLVLLVVVFHCINILLILQEILI